MPNVVLRKQDKLHALRRMVEIKFGPRYGRLMQRRQALAVRVYNDSLGDMGYHLKAEAGDRWQTWLETRAEVTLDGCEIPYCAVETGKPPSRLYKGYVDHFSGVDPDSVRFQRLQLPGAVVWPRTRGSDQLRVAGAGSATKRVANNLNRDIRQFNADVKAFYRESYGVLMHLRSTRQVDDKFPELWAYLPAGLRERIKQAVVPLSDDRINQLREQLPRGDK